MERKFPLLACAAWLAFVADVAATAVLIVSDAPTELTVSVVALQLLGVYTIIVWHVAKRH